MVLCGRKRGRHSNAGEAECGELLRSRLQRRVLCISTCRRSAAVLCIACIAPPPPPHSSSSSCSSSSSSSYSSSCSQCGYFQLCCCRSISPFSDKKIEMQIMKGTNQRTLVLKQKMEMRISIICRLLVSPVVMALFCGIIAG